MKILSTQNYNRSASFKSSNVFSVFQSPNISTITYAESTTNQLQKAPFDNQPQVVKTPQSMLNADIKNVKHKYTFPVILGSAAAALAIAFGVYSKIRKPGNVNEVGGEVSSIVSSYRNKLAEGLSEQIGKSVDVKSLDCVVDKTELLDILPKLSEQNYVYNAENAANGLFRADLHSHSSFSDGLGDVKSLLDQAVNYGNSLFEKTKEKFVFALTDHDGVEGVKKALQYIAEEPEKYKNIRFVPGAELSFVHAVDKGSNPTETSELLAHCINPFDKNVENFFQNIYTKRENMMRGFIDKLSEMFPDTKFSVEEFAKNYDVNLPKDTYAMNSHWRVFHYGQTKLAVDKLAKEQRKNPEKMYDEIMSKTARGKALGNLRDLSLIPNYVEENKAIVDLKNAVQPRVNWDGSITTSSENTLDQILDTFKKDEEVVFGFAHPFYLSERLNNPQEYIQDVVEKFNGKVKTTESYHQAYNSNISRSDIDKVNSYCENEKLITIGGRDNHKDSLF